MNELINEIHQELEDVNGWENKFDICYTEKSVKNIENKLSKLAFELEKTKPFYSLEIVKIKDYIFYTPDQRNIYLSLFRFGQILEIIRILKNDIFNQNGIVNNSKDVKNMKQPKIFISHSSKDIAYVEAFVNMLEKIGIKQEHLFCSSIQGYKIPLGENIYDFLIREFNDYSLYVIFMLSKNYYKSPACLNEMGATWALKSEYQSILLPAFKFSAVDGSIDPRKISFQLGDDVNRKDRLTELKDKIINRIGLPQIEHTLWERHRNIFFDEVDKFIEVLQKEPRKPLL